jgi:hypothetical protein
VVEEARSDQGAERRPAEGDHRTGEVDGGDAVLAVGAQVVADDKAAVGPADQHRPVQAQLVDDRGHVVGPQPGVGVVLGFQGRLRHPVAAEVVGHQPELLGQRALVLLGPAEMVLGQAVDEQDRRPVRPAPLADVQPQATAAPNRVDRSGLRDRCHLAPPRVRRIDWIVAVEGAGPHRSGAAYPSPPADVSSCRGMRTSAFRVSVGGVILAE